MHGQRSVADPALTLPLLPQASLPRYRSDVVGTRKIASLGAMLAERKLLKREDCANGLDMGVLKAVGRWLERSFGGFEFFAFKGSLFSDVFAACGESKESCTDRWPGTDALSMMSEAFDADLDASHVAIGLSAGDRERFLVGDGVERLESLVPGLGWTALKEICSAGMVYDLMEFGWIEDAARDSHWGGCDDEREFYESLGEDIEEYQGLSRAEFDESVPLKRMLQNGNLTTAKLRELASSDIEGVSEVAKLILQSRRLKKIEPVCNMNQLSSIFDWHVSLDPTGIMGWKDFDVVERICDDYAEMMYQGEPCLRDFTSIIYVPLTSGKALSELEMKLRGSLRRLRCADKLLSMIAVKETD